MRQPFSTSFRIDSHQVNITWTPGLGLSLRVLGNSYYQTRSHRSFPHDDLGNVSALDIRRAQEEMILKARDTLRCGK
jgi:hypothetical protein